MPDDLRSEYLAGQESWLGPWALRSADSGGRAHPEPPHPFRTCYQRDRDRIMHCSAFRRLGYKTQVFVPHEQDHFRTRLTHTLEVAQMARTLARALRANEDAAEAVALAHDLGHSPFGHAGEEALNELMADRGGFEHNRQSLRVVDYLEHPYPSFRGLNLTRAVRRCVARHETPHDAPSADEFDQAPWAPLEGQLVDRADEIAYTAADLYDALAAGWIETAQLGGLAIWQRAWERARSAVPSARAVHTRIQACRNVMDLLAGDVVAATARRLAEAAPTCPADVEKAPGPMAAFSAGLAGEVKELQAFLRANVYHHPEARRQDDQGRQIIRELFGAYLARPERLPPRYRRRIDAQGPHRVICDYVAGMTDRFCRQQHQRATTAPP